MKKLQWKNLARFGGLGCALLGTAAAAKVYGGESKWKENFSLLGFPHQALSKNNSTSNENPVTDKDATNAPLSKKLLLSNHECKDVGIGNQMKSELNESKTLEDAIEKASALCRRACDEYGLPGLAVGVSVNGKLIWEKGFGYGDVENSVPMNPRMIMRIASISKSMTIAMLGKLMDQGLIDLDAPIQTYLPKFPIKYVDGKQVIITTRHLTSHLSGIRHYDKKEDKNIVTEMSKKEYFIRDHFDSLEKSLELFQNDELFHEPGTKYMYTSHGFTVVSAIIEKIVDKPFDKYSKIAFRNWGLKNTYLDEHEPIIYNRVRYYSRDKDAVLHNSPYVDNSYKWAGGGFLSNTTDLMQFAHILLYSLQCNKTQKDKNVPYISKDTVQKLWTGDPRAISLFLGAPSDNLYGMGFYVGDTIQKCLFCKTEDLVTVYHGGNAIGASSILLVKFPKNFESTLGEKCVAKSDDAVKGVVVTMLTNLTNASLTRTANEIANLFKNFL